MEERSCEQLEKIAADANTLAAFLGPRDVLALTQEAILARLGQRQADVMALFGGSILAGGDVLAAAMRARVAGTYMIVGGAGHTTEALRERVRTLCPDLSLAAGATEAEIFEAYLSSRHGLLANFLERRSTNCGNNITYLRDLLKERGVCCKSLILVQDATMQRRMSAGLKREMPDVTPINFASYRVRMVAKDGELCYDREPLGMWDPRRYLSLLMGEIPRLTDDEGGYGPKGTGFLAHVDIPDKVSAAWKRLCRSHPQLVRAADPKFARP